MLVFAEIALTLIALIRGWRLWALVPLGALIIWAKATVESATQAALSDQGISADLLSARQGAIPTLFIGDLCALLVLAVMAIKGPPSGRPLTLRETILRSLAGRRN